MNFTTITYLKFGTSKQKLVHSILTQHTVLSRLQKYDPIFVGTIPLAIDIETSDIDIICYWTDKHEFITCLEKNFGTCDNFRLTDNTTLKKNDTILATFNLENFEFEIFGQNTPTQQQLAYKHIVIEHQLLMKHGETLRLKIIELKKQGYKTEPAFAHALGLKGNPYDELLKIRPEINRQNKKSTKFL